MAEREKNLWPGWEIGKCLGRGGFGAVYEISRDVFGDVEKKALKVITIPKDESEIEYMRCEGMDDESITTTFHSQVGDIIREYKMMSRLNENPHIVHCDDFRYNRHEDGLGWDIFIKMELLTPLMKAMDQVKTEAQIVRLGKELSSALISCQEINIIHRDIKPQNIFISPKGTFKLGDFGIARTAEHTTKATVGVGTYSFMAPEVALGKEYGPTVDIYSLGLVLYWLLNERRGPFVPLPPAAPTAAVNEEARRRRYGGEEIPAPKNGSDALQRVILKACAFDPKARYQTARELFDALNGIVPDEAGLPSFVEAEPVKEQEEETLIDSRDYVSGNEPAEPVSDGKEQVKKAETGKDEPVIEQKSEKGKRKVWPAALCAAVLVLAAVGLFVFAKPTGGMEETVSTSAPAEIQTVPTEAPVPQNILRRDDIDLIWSETTQVFEAQPVFDSNILRDEIVSITFADTLAGAPEDAWDVSEGETGSVLAWVVPNGERYDLMIAGDGGVIAPADCSMLFALYRNVVSIDFGGCFFTENTTNMSRMFAYCHGLTALDLSGLDTSAVLDMHAMFVECGMLETLNAEKLDTSSVRDMAQMFSGCSSLTKLDLISFDTSAVTSMAYMFYGCDHLTELNVQSFNTSSVKDMSHMFHLCSKLVHLDISSFDTGNVTDMSYMLFDCKSLTDLQLGTFNTENVEKHDEFMIAWKTVNGKTWRALFKDYVPPVKSYTSKSKKEDEEPQETTAPTVDAATDETTGSGEETAGEAIPDTPATEGAAPSEEVIGEGYVEPTASASSESQDKEITESAPADAQSVGNEQAAENEPAAVSEDA